MVWFGHTYDWLNQQPLIEVTTILDIWHLFTHNTKQFSVPQIEYPLGGSSKKCSHVYFLLQDFWVILLFCQIVLLFEINVVLMLLWWPDVTIVQSDVTIVVPWQLSTGSIHDYLFLVLPPSGYSIWGTENWELIMHSNTMIGSVH